MKKLGVPMRAPSFVDRIHICLDAGWRLTVASSCGRAR
jgi:hypothetical protein